MITVRLLGGLQSLELDAYDLFLRWRPPVAGPDQRIVLIGVTDDDIQRWRWPIADAILVNALQRLIAYRPRAIGLDIYRDHPIAPGSQRLDAVLIANTPIIAVMRLGNGGQRGTPPPHVLKDTDQFGFADVVTDPDGIVRRGLLFLDDGETVFYAFPLLLALRYLETHNIVPQPGIPNPEHLRLGQITLPPLEANNGGYINADMRGYQFLLDFQGAPPSFQMFSLTDVLSGRVPAEAIQDKIIIIGMAAQTVKDYFYIPFSRGFGADQHIFGIELHAHITSQLLRTGLDNTPPIAVISEWREAAWIWLWTALGGLVGLWIRSLWGFSLSAVAGLAVLGLIGYGLFLQRWWIPVVPPALGWFIAAAVVTSYMSNRERAERLLLKQLFSPYVSREVFEEIWRQREQFLEGGHPRSQRLTATVLFSDLRGFTAVSERLDPAELMDWLNSYMEIMAKLVTARGGVVDKFIGDAIMAVFGVPRVRTCEDEIRQDAIRAVNCAIAMGEQLRHLNALWQEQGLPVIGMRIGIFTGPLVAGSLGSRERMEYTVIGDTVNIASRLEGFNKMDMDDPGCTCRILIGEATWRYLDGRFQVRHVGRVSLKGKAEKIAVYQVLGRKDPNLISSE